MDNAQIEAALRAMWAILADLSVDHQPLWRERRLEVDRLLATAPECYSCRLYGRTSEGTRSASGGWMCEECYRWKMDAEKRCEEAWANPPAPPPPAPKRPEWVRVVAPRCTRHPRMVLRWDGEDPVTSLYGPEQYFYLGRAWRPGEWEPCEAPAVSEVGKPSSDFPKSESPAPVAPPPASTAASEAPVEKARREFYEAARYRWIAERNLLAAPGAEHRHDLADILSIARDVERRKFAAMLAAEREAGGGA